MKTKGILSSFVACLALVSSGSAQLRVGTWNVTNYSSGRVADFQTALFASFNGRKFAPDVLIGQEFLSQTGVNNFLSILNTATGSPGDYAAATFIDGADTDSAFFYRTSKVQYLGTTIVAVGSPDPANQPRNTYRYDFRPIGFTAASTTVACYSVHMKAGSTAEDQARRLVESQRIRTNAETLPATWNFIMAGDTNIQSSNQAADQTLVSSQVNNVGRFYDPISTPGDWNNNAAFRFVHTQEPSTQMDDRFDFLLLCNALIDGLGLDYIGNPSIPYSTTTWDDPNHSYRCWGNDGTSFDAPIRTTTNTMVGPTIAQALINTVQSNGHLPVYLDMRVPGRVNSTPALDFGIVRQGAVAQRTLNVSNVGDTQFWGTAGVANLVYTLTGNSKFSVPAGQFSVAPGANRNHTITLNTSTPGFFKGTISVSSDDPEQPVRLVQVQGKVFGSRGQ